ncbi:MAG: YesL family protein [Lachnospiraceae bacterium]|nr:YesL family protein [Lachnospiraceae bacterium]
MSYDNPVIRFLNKLTDLIFLNFLFLVFSLPVVTMGAALSAMYAVNLRSVREGDGYVAKRFWKAFRESFWQATAAWLMVLLCAGILFLDFRFWQASEAGMTAKGMLLLSGGIALILWMISLWVFPVIAKMRDPLKVQITNAAKMAFAFFLPHTAVCMLLCAGAAYLATISVSFLMLMAIFGIAFINWLCSFFIYKGFAKVIKEDPIGDEDYLYPQ